MNAGTNWAQLSSGYPDHGLAITLNSVYFPDIYHGYAGGDVGTIYRTMNGGLNWTQAGKTISDF